MFGAADDEWIRDLFRGSQLIEISAVVAIPRSTAPWGGKDELFYAKSGEADDGSIVYIRSHGARFNILPKPWLGQGTTGCYSIGPGLVGNAERTVVLGQVFAQPEAPFASIAEDPRWEASAVVSSTVLYGRRCHLFSAFVT